MENELLVPVNDNGKLSNIMVIDQINKLECEEYDLFSEKDFPKYIDDIEKSVRTSMEYNEFIMYLRNYMDMNRCALLNNVSNVENTKIKIELHHHPFSLHDIAVTIYNKRASYGESLERELVAKEAMYIHYFLYVGLVPLAKSVHKMIHNKKEYNGMTMFIPLNIVLGKYKEFMNQYGEWIPPEVLTKIDTYESLTKTYDSSINRKILEVAPVYLKIDGGDIGTYKLPKLQEVLGIMGDHLTELEDRSPKGILIDPYYKEPGESEDTKLIDKDGFIQPFIILDK